MKQTSDSADNICSTAEAEQPNFILLTTEHTAALIDILDLLEMALTEDVGLDAVFGKDIVGGAYAGHILDLMLEDAAMGAIWAATDGKRGINAMDVGFNVT